MVLKIFVDFCWFFLIFNLIFLKFYSLILDFFSIIFYNLFQFIFMTLPLKIMIFQWLTLLHSKDWYIRWIFFMFLGKGPQTGAIHVRGSLDLSWSKLCKIIQNRLDHLLETSMFIHPIHTNGRKHHYSFFTTCNLCMSCSSISQKWSDIYKQKLKRNQ